MIKENINIMRQNLDSLLDFAASKNKKGNQYKMMDITDKDNLWKITYHSITNLTTNEVRPVKNIPTASTISYMNYNLFIRSCEIAFNTGEWPNFKKEN